MNGQDASFGRGVASFKAQMYEDAIGHFSEAIQLGNTFMALDSRAAVYEKLGRPKEALTDARTLINTHGDRWQGYARAARSFKTIGKYDSAMTMVSMALSRLTSGDSKRKAELETLRSAVKDSLKHHQRLAKKAFYHFGTLPVEIANIIFSLVIEEDHISVIVLAQVCQHWRSIVVATPAFWGTLVITQRTKRISAKVKLWDSRSQGQIGTIHIGEDNPTAIDALNTLISIRTPLKNLKFDHVRLDVFKTAQYLIPTLESLELHSLVSKFSFSPFKSLRLRRLVAVTTMIDWHVLADLSTELRELVYYGSACSDTVSHILWLLHQNEHMQTLSLGLASQPSTPHLPVPRELPDRIEVPNLSSVSLSGAVLDPYELLSRLSFRDLRYLRLQQLRRPIDRPVQHFLSGAALRGLEKLEICQCSVVDMEVIVSVLRVATSLQSIQLNHMANCGIVLEALAQASTPSQSQHTGDETVQQLLCPKLTAVNFSHCPDVRDGPLIRLVKVRCAAVPAVADTQYTELSQDSRVAKLQSLVIDGCENVDASILPWIRQQIPHVSCRYVTKAQASWKR